MLPGSLLVALSLFWYLSVILSLMFVASLVGSFLRLAFFLLSLSFWTRFDESRGGCVTLASLVVSLLLRDLSVSCLLICFRSRAALRVMVALRRFLSVGRSWWVLRCLWVLATSGRDTSSLGGWRALLWARAIGPPCLFRHRRVLASVGMNR